MLPFALILCALFQHTAQIAYHFVRLNQRVHFNYAAPSTSWGRSRHSTELHLQAMELISQHNVDLAILVGKETNNASKYLKNVKYLNFYNSIDASQAILQYIENEDIIYIKGSRGIKLEEIVKKLQS